MSAEVSVNTTAFNAMCRSLAKMTGNDFESAVDYEAARVLEKALAGVPAANVAKIRANADKQKFGVYDVGNGPQKYNLAYRYPDALWAKIQAARKASLQRKLKARGLSKAAFSRLAGAAGLVIRRPAFVVKAVPSNGKIYNNERVVRKGSGPRYGLFVATTMPVLGSIRVNGRRALQRAINGRVKFFDRNLKLKVFQSAAAVAKKYPGVTISR